MEAPCGQLGGWGSRYQTLVPSGMWPVGWHSLSVSLLVGPFFIWSLVIPKLCTCSLHVLISICLMFAVYLVVSNICANFQCQSPLVHELKHFSRKIIINFWIRLKRFSPKNLQFIFFVVARNPYPEELMLLLQHYKVYMSRFWCLNFAVPDFAINSLSPICLFMTARFSLWSTFLCTIHTSLIKVKKTPPKCQYLLE